MKQKKNQYEAGAVLKGLTETKTSENEIYKISQTLGITKTDIKNSIKRRKYAILCAVAFVVVAAVSGNFYYIGNHYNSGSISDFQMLRWFL